MQEFITSIKGADGARSYKTRLFKLRELINLQLELGKILGGAAGPSIDYASGLFSMDKKGIHLAAGPEGNLDSRKLGTALAAIPQGILDAGGYDFVGRLLKNTSLEFDISGEGQTQDFYKLVDNHPGGDGTWMDNIFPGNLGELYLVLGWVLAVNFSPFGRGQSWSWKSLWQELSAKIPKQFLEKTVTEEQSEDGNEGAKSQSG